MAISGYCEKEVMKMVCGSYYIPKESSPVGDDAHFICEDKQSIGIADGVGGWARKGIDAGAYARELMTNAANLIRDKPQGTVDPKTILFDAYYDTDAEGSSTACLLTLTGQFLNVANIGDSGFVLIREGANMYRSPVQQHYFNCPYQLGFGPGFDLPNSAQAYKLKVKPGDLIVAGTDGLFDNMFPSRIKEFAKMGFEMKIDPELLALSIAERAFRNSVDKKAATPFSRAATKAGKIFNGGKPDDITLVVAYVVPCGWSRDVYQSLLLYG